MGVTASVMLYASVTITNLVLNAVTLSRQNHEDIELFAENIEENDLKRIFCSCAIKNRAKQVSTLESVSQCLGDLGEVLILSEEEMLEGRKELEENWPYIDTNGDGTLDLEEFSDSLALLSLTVSKSLIEGVGNPDGGLNMMEYKNIVNLLLNSARQIMTINFAFETELLEYFDTSQTDGNPSELSESELMRLLPRVWSRSVADC
ncbi:Oidioi.mRNA.OKI2018_I69.chr1.g9.t1.cds [Oikopleura dioica]|uniref:Oidioi.mRNA.OKI2018_I69.chr1.g9.t1.cds n=1 Tax=Oikopleura dioica TaxID=34765 RepID=A0ABN7SIZ6_OIKDI|nr:Oidioi.mRNA.OKI2018_I69.chr1.g9.t1.cds [Oikopleura dioica]